LCLDIYPMTAEAHKYSKLWFKIDGNTPFYEKGMFTNIVVVDQGIF